MRQRPVLGAALLLAALALAFVSPALLPGKVLSNSDALWFQAPWAASRPADLQRPANPELGDAPQQMQPFLRAVKRSFPDVPLWNPWITTGRPFLADAQSAPFSPFNLPALFMDTFRALALIAALKLWAAAFGAFLLGRALGMRWPGALLCGVVYGFNLWLVTWVSYPHASVWALIPWALVATEGVLRRPGARSAAWLALAIGVQFLAGHPESSFHLLVAVGLFALLRLRGSPAPKRAALLTALGVAWGAALAALVLLPFAELLLRSADLHQRAGAASDIKTPLKFALGIFIPFQWGKPTQTPLNFFLLARAFYGGALPLMLAGAALILRPTRERIATGLTGLACMLVVLGVPPLFQLVTHLPVFSSGHNTRLAVLYLLCLALLAGWGLDEVLERRRALLGVAAALLAFPLLYTIARSRSSWELLGDAIAVAFGRDAPAASDPAAGGVIRGAAVVEWTVVAVAGLLVLVAARRGVRWAAAAAIAVVFADLAWAGIGYNPAIDRRLAVQPATPAIRELQAAAPGRFVSLGDIPENAIPMDYETPEARGYDLPVEARFDRLWRTRISPEFPSQVGPLPAYIPLVLPKLDPERLRALSLLGVRRVLQQRTLPPLHVPGLRLIHPGPDARVYANRTALPRALVVGGVRRVASGDAALDAVTAPGFDARREAIVEDGGAAGTPGVAGAARIVSTENDRERVAVRAKRAGLLVVSDAWAPGWQARVDGRRVDVRRVDYLFRGVPVTAGRHTVEFAYEPLSWRIGWIVSLLALCGLAGALWRRR